MTQQKGNLFKNFTNEETKFAPSTTNLINNNPKASDAGLRVYLHLESAKEGSHISVDSIMTHTKLSRLKTIKAIKELENVRLLRREKSQINGRYEYNYVIYDVPFNATDSDEVDCNE